MHQDTLRNLRFDRSEVIRDAFGLVLFSHYLPITVDLRTLSIVKTNSTILLQIVFTFHNILVYSLAISF